MNYLLNLLGYCPVAQHSKPNHLYSIVNNSDIKINIDGLKAPIFFVFKSIRHFLEMVIFPDEFWSVQQG